MQYQEFEDTIFTTFSEDFLDKKNAYDVKVKKGSKIYKTVFCNDVVLFHGPIKEQIPNQVFFPYTPMVYSRDIQGNFIGCIDYLIQLQDLWNVELSKLFHYSNSKMLIVNSDTTTRKYEDLVKAYSIESKKKRGFLQFDPKDVTVIDNSNDIKGILNSLEMLNREFQNISGLFDDFAGKPTNAQSGIAIQNRINTTMNAQNPLILAYEYMLTSEGKLMLDTLKGIENFKQLLSFYNEGKQDSVVLDSNIALLNFEVYPVSAPNFSSSIEEERELFTNIMSSGLADIFLSSPLFLQQVGIGEVSSYKLSSEYKRIMLEKMQLQQGILPNNQENQQEE